MGDSIWSHYHHLERSLRMRSITWPMHRGPPRPHVTICWRRIIYSLYNIYGATMTIKGSFILGHPNVKAIFGRKNRWRERDKIGKQSDVHDIVTHANFCQNWSKVFSVSMGRILAFSIELLGSPLQHARITVRVWFGNLRNDSSCSGLLRVDAPDAPTSTSIIIIIIIINVNL